jgi:hypothetical protein
VDAEGAPVLIDHGRLGRSGARATGIAGRRALGFGRRKLIAHEWRFKVGLGGLHFTIGDHTAFIDGCGAKHISDISAGKLRTWLHERRTAGLSPATSNYILAAGKTLCRWLVRDQRTAVDPLAHLARVNAQASRRPHSPPCAGT